MLHFVYTPPPFMYDNGIGIDECAPIGSIFGITSLVLVFFGIIAMFAMLVEDEIKSKVSLDLTRVFFVIISASAICTLLSIILSCFNI